MWTRRATIASGLAAVGCASVAESPVRIAHPLVIAHRGASGYRPEHTRAAYRLAIAQGADFIEPDLVVSKDGVLFARHENEISETTDIAARPEFAARRTTKEIDAKPVSGWFTEDLTAAELKTLRCRERLPQLRPGNAAFDGQEAIPTFDEVCALAAAESKRLGRTIGVYPETKHPSYFASIGLSFDQPLLGALRRHDLDRADAPVFVQSFETGNLKRLARLTRAPLIQLLAEDGMPFDHLHTSMGLTYAAMVRGDGLRLIATYAAGIGPQKTMIVPRDGAGRAMPATDLVARAHDVGLKVHPWTFRNENYFLPADLRRGDATAPDFQRLPGDGLAELKQFFALGVDGVFADFPDMAVAARDR
ncbi:MAG: glycerophosphodiester phosphodiesterase [Caulobacterales bacterium]|jgi:glycerophosphoryl diester phosphodiesterase